MIENRVEQIEIRRFLPDDEPQLLKAWSEAYPKLLGYKYPRRWRWNIFDNPFVPPEKRPLFWVAIKDGEIAAWTSAMAVPIDVAGRQVVGAHSVDTFTRERYRRYGLGKRLQAINQAAHSVFVAIDPSPANRRNKYKVGGHPGKPLDTWLRIGKTLDLDILYDSFLSVVTKYFGAGSEALFIKFRRLGLPRLLALVCSLALRIRQGRADIKAEDKCNNLNFETINRFGEASDRLWQRTREIYSFAISRNSIYLNWKYVHQPDLNYCKALATQDGEPVGLLIYRFPTGGEQQIGIISECFCHNDSWQLHAALITHAVEDFERHGISTIKCGASTKSQRKALRMLGFSLVDIDVPVFHLSPQELNLDLQTIMSKEWLLSLGDSDIDQIRTEHQPSFVEIVRLVFGKVPGSEHLAK